MKTPTIPPDESNDILTYRRLRKIIGLLALSLPVTLVVLSLIPLFKTSIQSSISYYYYSNLREVLTGVLCAVSLFLIRYRGYYNPVFWKNDNIMTNAAGIMALGVALFPTNPHSCAEKIYTLIPFCINFIGVLHYLFAAAFFLILAEISLAIFTIGQEDNKDIPKSSFNENNIYKVCGISIMVFTILIPLSDFLHLFPCSTLILEALALGAFGASWLIKGRILGDKGKLGRMIYREHH